MSEPCTDKWHSTDKCPSCGMEDTGYDRGFRDGAARVAPSDGLQERIGDIEPKLTHEGIVWVPYDAVLAALATTGQPEHESWCYRRHVGDCVDGPAQPEDTRTADPGGLPRVSRRDGDTATCEHATVLTYRFEDRAHPTFGQVALWCCDDCGLRFDPRALTPEATAPGLDVERLHSAMAATEAEVARQGVIVGRDADLSDYAEAIAERYAHLRATVEGT
jgi:hypothetical protein